MTGVRQAVRIDRDAQTVFDYLADMRHLPEWMPEDFARVAQESPGPISAGERFRYVTRGERVDGTFAWTEFQRDHTQVTVVIEPSFGGLPRVFAPMTRARSGAGSPVKCDDSSRASRHSADEGNDVLISPTKSAGRTIAVIMVGAAAASLAACGGGGSTAPNLSTLAIALRQVQNNTTTRTEVQFGRPAAALVANRHKLAAGQYGAAIGYGLGQLAPVMAQAKHAFGFDPAHASYAITAGQPPHVGTLVSGLRLAATPAKLRALGATRSGSTFRFAPDNQVMMHGRLANALPGLVVGFNVVGVDGSDFRFGASSASIAQSQATGSGLMSYAPMAAVASCLNNPLAADIVNKLPDIRKLLLGRHPPRSLSARLGALRPTAGLQMVGVGLSGTAGMPPTEQMCVSEDSVQHANQAAAAVRTALHHGMSLVENRPWNQMLTAASVRVEGSTVSLTAHPGRAPGGILLHALLQGDLPGVYG